MTTQPEQRTAGVAPWLLDVAQNLVRVVREADHFGTATFSTALCGVTVMRTADGVSVNFDHAYKVCDGEFAGPAACVCGHPESHE